MLRLSLALLLVGGCFGEPGRPSAVRDGGGSDADAGGDDGGHVADGAIDAPIDASNAVPTAHLVSTANYSSSGHSTGMSTAGWEISTGTGVSKGELVVLFANVDNGSIGVFRSEDLMDWTVLARLYYTTPDEQSVLVAARFVDSDPGAYAGTYGSGINSGAAAFALIAVDGVDGDVPLTMLARDIHDHGDHIIPIEDSAHIAAVADNSLLLFAMGIDWQNEDDDATFTRPSGWTKLAEITDTGDATGFQYTTEMVASHPQPGGGDTGVIHATMSAADSTQHGGPWSALIAIPPHN